MMDSPKRKKYRVFLFVRSKPKTKKVKNIVLTEVRLLWFIEYSKKQVFFFSIRFVLPAALPPIFFRIDNKLFYQKKVELKYKSPLVNSVLWYMTGTGVDTQLKKDHQTEDLEKQALGREGYLKASEN